MARKAPGAYQTISEVSVLLDVPAHVLRFWESKFSVLRPMKRSGGRRYYRTEDIQILQKIKSLLYDEGYTIKGAQNSLKKRSHLQTADRQDRALWSEETVRDSNLIKAEKILKEADKRMAELLRELGC